MELKIGDKVRLKHWSEGKFLEVLAIGNINFFTRTEDGYESIWNINDDNWLPYIEQKDDLVKDAIKDYGDDDLENRIAELSEQLKSIKKRVDETLDFAISNITKQNNRITALEQLQPKQAHPDANDNQPTVKNCDNCKYRYRDRFKRPCIQCSGLILNYVNWEQA